ncbi:MAG: PqiC family protein [Nevskia sp.]|nr:PqiC family protein [Nevskia sp.]
MKLPKSAILAATGLLAACSAVPTHYYTLLPPPVAGTPAAPFQIEVQPVDVPAQVATPEMVVRAGDGEMVPVDTRRWIAPLGDEIRGALSALLTQRLGARDVYGLPGAAARAGAETYAVDVKVLRFESAPGAYARIDAVWAVRRVGDGAAAVVCSGSFEQPVAAGYEALAQGHQKALSGLADRVAAAVTASRAAPAGALCPAG